MSKPQTNRFSPEVREREVEKLLRANKDLKLTKANSAQVKLDCITDNR